MMGATFNNPFAGPLRELRELRSVEGAVTPGAKLERLREISADLELACSIYPLDQARRVLLHKVHALIAELEGDQDAVSS
jgi:hypothetical protein